MSNLMNDAASGPQELKRSVAPVKDAIPSGTSVLVTGANGFIGSWVVRWLLRLGIPRIRCCARAGDAGMRIAGLLGEAEPGRIEVVKGNLLSPDTCRMLVRDVSVIYHLAAGVEKSFPGCFLNSAVATRNLIEAAAAAGEVRRLVSISSLAVYDTNAVRRGQLLDESCPVDQRLCARHDAYAYGKAKQDDIVKEYGGKLGVPYVIVRPGVTFGPGKVRIPGRVGTDTFGVFLHLGLGNTLPLTYVENCAEAIVLAGLRHGIDGEEVIVVDDDLPTSRRFLTGYRRHVRRLFTVPMPYWMFYTFSAAWEWYSSWSDGQLPPVFNRLDCTAYFKRVRYSNQRAKALLGWTPRVGMDEALERFYAHARAERSSR